MDALGQIANGLFNSMTNDTRCFVLVSLVGVERSLRDEAVRKWNAEDASDTGSEAREEDVLMETGWLAKRELASLGDQE